MEDKTEIAIPFRNHRAGFVSIIGKPNVGKSTLMNVLVGERMSIITSKAQTTRHRIMGILNGKHEDIPFQLVYSDTPGVIKPAYKLHDSMMTFVKGSLEDADVVLFVAEIGEKVADHEVLPLLKRADAPVVLVLNKIDLSDQEHVDLKMAEWEAAIQPDAIVPISALHQANIATLFDAVITRLPFHPPYFGEDELTDKPERFFASEMIREKIFLNYRQEIPYSSEVVITEFKERDDMIVIRAEILVERKSQKGIIIGEKGEMLKKIGTQARHDMEAFFGKKVFLEQHVRVEPDWRSKENKLRQFGYDE
ncbi:GTPase Era [Dyadobacter chenwenxiniae]|uniref:GTPase Era n=1 Tax=Dyadobacter chenwenxiniae TaxID=2906456 RepID=A0A9X1PJY9_9BACT|nr:GTPase Era [Dyadobacter chenwenxiniae]MCF0049735.1 GTPase Era [Dyadobacter chenwenxiniae]MCF0062161.1 GTPase Era [Dyadobacter chenwenxiniae]UON81965.1 GTPase Era [Dyadobacter chenwenxiniae]